MATTAMACMGFLHHLVKPATLMFMMMVPVFMILLIITEKLVIMNSIAGTFL